MKLKSFLFAAATILAIAACKKENVPVGLTVDGSEKMTVSVPVGGATQVIKLSSSESWTAKPSKDWVQVSPAQGAAGVTEITVTVEPNKEKSRTASVKITAGMFKSTISIKQASDIPDGDGSKANPFSASEAHAWVMDNLENDKTTSASQKYYVKGKIHKINTYNSVEQYYSKTTDHKATFYISDDGNASEEDFEAYQVYYLGGRAWREGDDDIKVGDEVIVYGQLKRHNTIAETGGSYDYLYSLNGATVGKAPAPDISKYETKTIKEFIDLAKTDTYYVISGIVSNFQLEGNPTQCMLSDGTGTVQMYGVDDMSAFAGVKNDGTLTIAAKYKKYEKNGSVTHEAVDCIFGSFVEGQSVEPKGTGTQSDPYNPAGAIAYITSLGTAVPSANEVFIKGKIASITNEFDKEHGTAVFDISEDGTMKTTFKCYSVKFLENKEWDYGNTQIKKGDDVIVKSKVTVYNGIYETLSAQDGSYKGYIYSLNGATSETAKPVIVVTSFKETAKGVSAEWVAPEAVTSFTVSLYKESVAEANLVKTDNVTAKTVAWEVALEPSTKYVISVSGALGEETLSGTAELTTATPAAANEIDFTQAPKSADKNKVVWENDYLTLTLTKETSSSDANNYIGGLPNPADDNGAICPHTRVYKNQKLTFVVKEGKTVATVVLTATSSDYAKKELTWTGATAKVSDSDITVTPTATTFSATVGAATRFTKLTVNAE